MADFDPDAYLGAPKDPGDFDPDGYLGADASADVGPPASAAPPPEEVHPSKSYSAAAGWLAGIPGVNPAMAAAESAIGSIGTRESLLNNYRKHRDEIKKINSAAAEEHPGYYYGANIPANIATAVAAGAAVPGKVAQLFEKGAGAWGAVAPHVGRMLGNAGLSVAGRASDETLEAKNVVRDVAAGEAARLVALAAMKPAKELGRGIRAVTSTPLRAVSEWLGDTSLGKWVGEGADDVGGRFTSQEIKDMQATANAGAGVDKGTIIDRAATPDTLEGRLAKAADEGRAELGPKGFAVNPAEFGDDMAKTVRNAHDEALRRLAPDYVSESSPVFKMRDDAQKIRESFAQKADDLAAQEKFLKENPGSENWPMGVKPPEGSVPNASPVRGLGGTESLPGEPIMRNTASHEENVARFGDRERPDWWNSRWKKNPTGDEQGDLLREKFFAEHAGESNPNYRPPTGQPKSAPTLERAAELEEAAGKVSQRSNENRTVDLETLLGKARKMLEQRKQSSAAQSVVDAGKEAEERIARIARGRKTLESGLGVAGALGGGTRGVAEAVVGLGAGKGALKAVDAFGAAGDKLAAMQSWAEKLAQRDDQIGRMAQYALSGKGDALISRLAVLADMVPER